ncbi:MAG: HDIG domain-containing protein [bacterium]|nr:HDIG domain-containing protein [bacterium]
MKKKIRTNSIILFAAFLVVLNLMYPAPINTKFNLQIGTVAPRDIIAPCTFYIQKNKSELQMETEKAKQSVVPVLRKTLIPASQQASQFFQKLDEIKTDSVPYDKKKENLALIMPTITEQSSSMLLKKPYSAIRDTLISLIDEFMEKGVIESTSLIISPIVVIVGQEVPTFLENFIDYDNISISLKEKASSSFKDKATTNAFVEIGEFFIKPNLKLDYAETEKRKEQIIAQVKPTKGIIQKGEIIVRAHDIVTPSILERLSSLPQSSGETKLSIILGRNVIYIIAIFVLLLCIYFLHLTLLNDLKKMGLLLLLLAVTAGMTSIVLVLNLSGYLIPVATFGILVSLLLGTQVGIIGVITLTILISAYTGGDFGPIILSLFAGNISVFASSNVKRSFDFYKPLAYLALAYGVTAVAVELLKLSPFLPLLVSVGWALLGGVASAFIAFGLLPLFENAFKITTSITLLEYADFNHPMMQRLAVYAPGTYHHSITVANLAEAGARAVNAYPLLARVGAYYHDIGKLKKPNYFVENQGERHRNSKIKPELNALVVISHVKEGVELAQSEGFPKEIVDIIASHHGTTMASMFYQKAKENESEGSDVNELDFRYPGPLPKTKEAAIVMLADVVEATARSVDSPAPNKLKNIIEETIKMRLEENQLSMANLSLEELRKIESSFLPILMGVFHPRISYEKNISSK